MKALIILLTIVSLNGNVKVDGVKATTETPITLDSYVETGLNSKLILDNGLILGPMKKGLVSTFVDRHITNRKNENKIAEDYGVTKKAVITSSSRASDAKDDLDWEEE